MDRSIFFHKKQQEALEGEEKCSNKFGIDKSEECISIVV
jgi:hypothetical protein